MTEKTHHAEEGNSLLREARQHAKSARESMRQSLRELVPPGFMEHRRAARREMLLAMRSLLDAAIERTDKKPSE